MDLEGRGILDRYMQILASELEQTVLQQMLEEGLLPEPDHISAHIVYHHPEKGMQGDPYPSSVPEIWLSVSCPCPGTYDWLETRDRMQIAIERTKSVFHAQYPVFPGVLEYDYLTDVIVSDVEIDPDEPGSYTLNAKVVEPRVEGIDAPCIGYLGRFRLESLRIEPELTFVRLREPL